MKGLLREKFLIEFDRSSSSDADKTPAVDRPSAQTSITVYLVPRLAPAASREAVSPVSDQRSATAEMPNVEGGGSDHRPASLSTSLDSRPDRGQMFTVPVPSAGRTINSEPSPNRPHVAIER